MSCLLTCLRMFLRSCSWAGEGDRNLLARVQATLWTILRQVGNSRLVVSPVENSDEITLTLNENNHLHVAKDM
jgi:hypothetical protein